MFCFIFLLFVFYDVFWLCGIVIILAVVVLMLSVNLRTNTCF